MYKKNTKLTNKNDSIISKIKLIIPLNPYINILLFLIRNTIKYQTFIMFYYYFIVSKYQFGTDWSVLVCSEHKRFISPGFTISAKLLYNVLH